MYFFQFFILNNTKEFIRQQQQWFLKPKEKTRNQIWEREKKKKAPYESIQNEKPELRNLYGWKKIEVKRCRRETDDKEAKKDDYWVV